MSRVEVESCPICWRQYSAGTAIPVCLPCGHSFCRQCCQDIRSCSLCRQRFPASTPRSTNYALMSLTDKLNAIPQLEKVDRQIQTDFDQILYIPRPRKLPMTSESAGRQRSKPVTLSFNIDHPVLRKLTISLK